MLFDMQNTSPVGTLYVYPDAAFAGAPPLPLVQPNPQLPGNATSSIQIQGSAS